MGGAVVHILFDIAAWLSAGAAVYWLTRIRRLAFPAQAVQRDYVAALLFGAGIGACLFGTANLWLSGQSGLARSVEGALAGGIVAIELYKKLTGVTVRTGARFALPLAVGIAVGRVGCFASGLDDFTWGTPSTLPWAHDFGDGVARHPVQLYESLAMLLFAAVYVIAVVRDQRLVIENGFYLALGWYGLQRFVWEFLKPYGAVAGPFTLFHLLSMAILAYAVVMLATSPAPRIVHERAAA